MFFSAIISSAVLGLATLPAQDANVELLSGPDAAFEWNVVSRSSATVYMVDINSVKTVDGVTSANMARVPASGENNDLTHSVNKIDFRCSANQVRPGEEVLYAADGSIEDRINDGYDFDTIPANSLDSYTKDVVCGNERSTQSYPSIQAFIAAGRPQG